MKPLDRALSLRRSTRLRSMEPVRVFHNRLREPRRLLRLAEQKANAQSTRFEARRQFLVAVTAASELFWRVFVRINVDRCRLRSSTLDRLRKMTFTLADVQTIAGRRLSLGELIAASYSFQGTNAVNVAFSEILQINVFSEFANESFAIVEMEWYKVVKDAALGSAGAPGRKWTKAREPLITTIEGRDILKRDSAMVDRCYAVRHDAVHSSGRNHRVGAEEALRIENSVWEFNVVLGLFLETRFDKLWGPRRDRE